MGLFIFLVYCYNYVVIKIFFIKHKRIISIILAVAFLVALFLIKNTSVFTKSISLAENKQKNGLDTMTLEELVQKDTDGDGIPDWQEGLYGLDPAKKETTPGIPDSTAINKLKSGQEEGEGVADGGASSVGTENLTETEKFSRELFSTIAATSQNGTIDPATIDALGASLAEKIKNPVVRKVFLLSDIKIIEGDSLKAFTNYVSASEVIHKKNPEMKYTVLDVLQEFMVDEDNVNISALEKLDPLILQTNKIIDAMTKMDTPRSIAPLHLNIINSLEELSENISDIKLFDTDVIVSLGAISKYSENTIALLSNVKNLQNAMQEKLEN